MNTYTQEITLDISAQAVYQFNISAKQEDNATRYVIVTLTENGEVITPASGCTAEFRGTKPDGKSFLNDATINSDGTITAELTAQVLAAPGNVFADIVLLDDSGAILSTASFRIHVVAMPFNAPAALSSNEFLIFLKYIEKCEEATDNANKAAEDAREKMSEIEDEADKAIKNANDAADSANTAADNANKATDAVNEAIANAEKATDNANEAADNANNAAQNATTTVTNLVNDTNATIDKLVEDTTATIDQLVDDTNDTVDKLVEDTTNTVNEFLDDANDKLDTAIDNAEIATEDANEAARRATEAAEALNEAAYLKTVVLSTDDWYETTDGRGVSCYACDTSMKQIISSAAWSVMISVPVTSYSIAMACGIYPTATISEGMFTIYAQHKPSQDLTIECMFFNQTDTDDEANQIYIENATVESSQWTAYNNIYSCTFTIDVTITNDTSWSVMVALDSSAYDIARECTLYPMSAIERGDNGAQITLYAESIPTGDLPVECTIFSSTIIS